MYKVIFFSRAFFVGFVCIISHSSFAVQDSAPSGIEIMQTQSRQLKTTNVKMVSDVVQDAFMDLNWGGWTYEGSGTYRKLGATGNTFPQADVNISLNSDRKITIIRISLNKYNKDYQQIQIYDANEYAAIFSAISKSLFLSSQKISLETLK